jgi:hypothetical protein
MEGIMDTNQPENTANDPEKINVPGIEEQTDKIDPSNVTPIRTDTLEERKKAAKVRGIEQCFDSLTPGDKISITRLRPLWCQGWLDTITVEFDDSGRPEIDLHAFKESYGGDKLLLRFLNSRGDFVTSKTVDFAGTPPRDHGEDIENPVVKQRRELLELEAKNKASDNNRTTEKFFEKMLEMQQSNTTQLLQVYKRENNDSGPLSQMEKLFTLMEMFDRFRGPQQQQQGGSDDITQMLGSLMGALGQQQQQPQQPARQLPQQPRHNVQQIRMPGVGQPVTQTAPPPTPPPPQREPEPEPVPNDGDDSDMDEEDIVDELLSMDDEELSSTVADLFNALGEERAMKIYAAFAAKTSDSGGEDTPQ